jgi:magnesium transporter
MEGQLNKNLEGKSVISRFESKPGCLDDILKEKLEKAYHKQISKVVLHELAKIACEHSPIDLAYAASYLPPNVRPVLYENLPSREAKIRFIVNTDSETRLALFRHLNDLELKKLFEKMPTDEAVWTAEDMSERRFRRLMEQINTRKAGLIREQRKHRRNSAGRLMTSEFFAFTMDMTIGDAAIHIRDNPRIDFLKEIFILNQAGELQGYVPARNLMINPSVTPLRQVMRPILHKVLADATREEVIDIVERYKLSSLPVVDIDDYLIGVITHEDVVEAMEDLADETIAHMAGTKENFASHDSVLMRFLTRAPWLIATLIAGLINGGVISSFENHVLTFVLFFIPLITGMSGNVGLQCSTVLVRSMAIGIWSGSASRRETIKKELESGFLTGIIFGIGAGLLIYLFNYTGSAAADNVCPWIAGTIVAIGLFGSCIVAALLGVISPLFFARIGVDPAIAAGPVVTACNDFLSLAIYFFIAWGVGSMVL